MRNYERGIIGEVWGGSEPVRSDERIKDDTRTAGRFGFLEADFMEG